MASPPEPAQAEPRAHGELTIRKKTRYKEEKAADRKAKSEQAERQYNGILASVDNDMERLLALMDDINAYSPCASYSLKNKAIVIANDTRDARTFLQWKEAERMVKKGAKAFYIYKPRVFKDRGQTDENGNPVKEAVLFGFIPVFRYEDTEPADSAAQPVIRRLSLRAQRTFSPRPFRVSRLPVFPPVQRLWTPPPCFPGKTIVSPRPARPGGFSRGKVSKRGEPGVFLAAFRLFWARVCRAESA
jgi:hypothetical protein